MQPEQPVPNSKLALPADQHEAMGERNSRLKFGWRSQRFQLVITLFFAVLLCPATTGILAIAVLSSFSDGLAVAALAMCGLTLLTWWRAWVLVKAIAVED